MTIRSMPPASSHLAEIPVPAPPPMMGLPFSALAYNFLRIALRGIAVTIPFYLFVKNSISFSATRLENSG